MSQGKADAVEGGDRLPCVESADGDNFAALASLDWQVHVYGETQAAFAERVAAASLALHHFPWTEAAGKAGLMRDAVYLVRPDGHVGLASETQDVQAFTTYIAELGIKPRPVS